MSASAPRSIRARLLAGTSAVLLAVLGAAAWLAYDASEDEAEELFDARLASSARVLDALVARQLDHATVAAPIVVELPEPVRRQPHDEASPLGHFYETRIAFQVRDQHGRVLARSASAPHAPLAPLVAGFSTQPAAGHSWRVFTLPSGRLWVQVADSDEARGEISAKLALAAVTPLLAGMLLLLLLLSALIRYGLAPLAELADRIRARRPDSLDPITLRRSSAEIAPVAEALNGLLARVQEALARERRFTAHAAHELRTPLAALQVHAQNAARAATSAERQASLEHMLTALERTVRLAAQMLAYSRAAAGAPDAPAGRVSLRRTVEQAFQDLRPAALARGVALELACEPPTAEAAVRGTADQLASLAGNLVDNAIRHGGGRVRVELREDSRGVSLAVEDAGPGIRPEYRERVFESYFRAPDAAGEGSGLGLAIVREVARQLGARVELADGCGGRGTRVEVRFPLGSFP